MTWGWGTEAAYQTWKPCAERREPISAGLSPHCSCVLHVHMLTQTQGKGHIDIMMSVHTCHSCPFSWVVMLHLTIFIASELNRFDSWISLLSWLTSYDLKYISMLLRHCMCSHRRKPQLKKKWNREDQFSSCYQVGFRDGIQAAKCFSSLYKLLGNILTWISPLALACRTLEVEGFPMLASGGDRVRNSEALWRAKVDAFW